MKQFAIAVIAFFAAVLMSYSVVGAANAANETATAGLTMTAQKGSLYKDAAVPVNWRVDVEVKAPFPASPKVLPMKNVKVQFPLDMSFHPDNAKTPVCPDDKVGPDANLSFPPDTIIDRCPKSVIGNGTAGLYLAKVNYANGPNLDDPVLIVFNGGTNAQGLPRMKIYGYSAQTNYGVYMEGTLDNGVLDVAIPVLSYDSAVGDFNLNIPGSNAEQVNRRGLDPNYVQAKCSTGEWKTNATFTLGEREPSVGPESTITAPEVITPCTGLAGGAAKFATPKVKGPKAVKKGKKGTYKVTVKNTGKAAANKVVVKGKGAKAAVGTLAGGQSKTVKLKVKVTGKKGKKVTLSFKATGQGVKAATGKIKVKVK